MFIKLACINGYLSLVYSNAGTLYASNTIDYTTTSNISANAWHYYALFSNTTTFKLYVDNVLISTNTFHDTFYHNFLETNDYNLGDSTHSCAFLFDDFHVFTAALQESDITSLYNLYSNPGVLIPLMKDLQDQQMMVY